jgi:hypothetical protein
MSIPPGTIPALTTCSAAEGGYSFHEMALCVARANEKSYSRPFCTAESHWEFWELQISGKPLLYKIKQMASARSEGKKPWKGGERCV